MSESCEANIRSIVKQSTLKMNILVTGANGQLGNEMRIVAAEASARGRLAATSAVAQRKEPLNFIFTDIAPETEESLATLRRLAPEAQQATEILDITDAAAVRETIRKHGIDCIVNCAAYTNVDAAETNEPLARKLNAEAPKILAEALRDAASEGIFIHISTDYVFGKEPYNTPCGEEQKGTPTGVYGATKLQGEENIKASGCRSIIIRTAWLYSEFGKNFCRTMLGLTATKPQLSVVFDQTGTPTYARDLAGAIMEILKTEYAAAPAATAATRIFHFSNEGVCSWYDFTKAIQRIDNELRTARGAKPTACEVNPCHSSEFPSPVKRPAYSVLDKTKIKTAFGLTIPYWMDSLKECITKINL